MKKINFNFLSIFLLTLFFSFSCSSLDFSEDKKVNKITNKFYKKGNFYHCNYQKSYSSGYKEIPSGFTDEPEKFYKKHVKYGDPNFSVSRNVRLVETNKTIGVILDQPVQRWSGTTNFLYQKHGGNKSKEYCWGGTIVKSKWSDGECDPNWTLLFEDSILKINPSKTYFRDHYLCSKMDLTNLEKKRLVGRFLDRYSKGE